MQPTWVKDLPDLFEKVGLENVKNHEVGASKKDSFSMFECNQLAYEMLLGNDEELRKLFSEAATEARKGVMIEVDRVSVIGRKALDAED